MTALPENVTLLSNSYCLHKFANCHNRLLKSKTRKLPPQCCFPINEDRESVENKKSIFSGAGRAKITSNLYFHLCLYIYII